MTTRSIESVAAIVISSVLAFLQTGCVASSTYEQAQEKAYVQHQQDQRQLLDLSVGNKRLKERVEAPESSLQSTREQLTRTEQERKEMRDELLKLKIEKEQQPGRRQARLSSSPYYFGLGNSQLLRYVQFRAL
jgi:hypothetical protein